MIAGRLDECFQYALTDGYTFAEITRIGPHCCEYTYGAHVENIIEKMCWQTKYADLLHAEWYYYGEGFIVSTENPENFINLYQSVKHSSRAIP